ncbi:hypothetical protein [Streptomyces sp. NPDC047071]|uniref:hypothetical protein n=1 Tax=Streptomyces sp. NPDC047071 TaxID=3154808 RepID=UPI0034520EB9
MADEQRSNAVGRAGDVEELTALIRVGGFRKQVPDWWPRVFDPPTPRILRAVEDGLGRLL